MKIAKDRVVTAAYVFRDEHGESIYGSDTHGPMVYLHGSGAVLAGIEAALEGRSAGEKVSVTLSPEQAFGAHRPELVFEAIRANLPPDVALTPGAEFYSGIGDRPAFRLRVVRVTDAGAVLDGNHPLAGKTLSVELEVLDVRAPSEAELRNRRPAPAAAAH